MLPIFYGGLLPRLKSVSEHGEGVFLLGGVMVWSSWLGSNRNVHNKTIQKKKKKLNPSINQPAMRLSFIHSMFQLATTQHCHPSLSPHSILSHALDPVLVLQKTAKKIIPPSQKPRVTHECIQSSTSKRFIKAPTSFSSVD
jgi:hypothetical protein